MIGLERLKNLIISNIDERITVYSQKGRTYESKNRSNFGVSFCESGSIVYSINDKKIVSDKTCAVILPYGGRYTLYGSKTGYFPLINFSAVNPLEIDEIIKINISNPQFYLKEYENLRRANMLSKGKFEKMQILYGILKHLSDESKDFHPALKYAQEFIENHCADLELSNTVIAEKCNISEVYLRKLFSEQLGLTPKQYIIGKRMQKAMGFLCETNLSVSEISLRCGFASVYHFCREFKLRTNKTPTQYRAKLFADAHFLA